jgi:serine/threonine protein phosphatase PrpC
MPLALEYALLLDRGLARQRNEDRCGAFVPRDQTLREQRGHLFVVADGVGGHAAGDVAAEIAVETIQKTYFEGEWEGVEAALRTAFGTAHRAILDAASTPARAGMGAATVAAAVNEDKLVVAHVGDARAYLVRTGETRRLTLDHSWAQEQVAAGRLTPEEAQVHRYRHVITRALGVDVDGRPDITEYPIQPGDTLLLCSDGLSDVAEDEDLASAADAGDAEEIARALVDLALSRGSSDNISVVTVRVRATGPKSDTLKLPQRGTHESG